MTFLVISFLAGILLLALPFALRHEAPSRMEAEPISPDGDSELLRG